MKQLTKLQLIRLLERFPVADDATVNVSIDGDNICPAKEATITKHPGDKNEFCLDFTVHENP